MAYVERRTIRVLLVYKGSCTGGGNNIYILLRILFFCYGTAVECVMLLFLSESQNPQEFDTCVCAVAFTGAPHGVRRSLFFVFCFFCFFAL